MIGNKKIKNATPLSYDGIAFKSQLEVMTYKTLFELGLNPQYEKEKYVLWDGFIPTVPFYTKNNFKRKNHNIEVLSPFTVKDRRPVQCAVYVPDFTFDYKGRHIIVEVKGFSTDTFKYRFKLFRKSLECREDKDKLEIWEIFTKKQLLDCIRILKEKYD